MSNAAGQEVSHGRPGGTAKRDSRGVAFGHRPDWAATRRGLRYRLFRHPIGTVSPEYAMRKAEQLPERAARRALRCSVGTYAEHRRNRGRIVMPPSKARPVATTRGAVLMTPRRYARRVF
jgi:hypothetical protein